MSGRVSVVIPCWNGRVVLEKNLPAFLRLKGVKEWILVDDGSTDGSAKWVRGHFPKVKVIVKKTNDGFAATADLGVTRSSGELVAIINHDLRPRPDAVIKTLVHFRRPEVFGVTFRETGEKGWGVARWKDGWIELSAGGVGGKKPHETFWGSGGETIYRKKVWESLGGYDLIFSPGYWEDVDLGYRARKRGWRLMWEPSAVLESAQRGESFSRRWDGKALLRIKERNRLLLIWKNVTSARFLGEHLWGLLGRLATHPGYLVVVLMALKRWRVVFERRRIERREAKLTDEKVFQKFVEA